MGRKNTDNVKDRNWGIIHFLRWKVLPGWLKGNRSLLRKYKDNWVRAHKKDIKKFAVNNNLPPELLAGVAWIEVGGDPDCIDKIAYWVRSFDHACDPLVEPLTITKKPELTSLGDVSIQLRRAAETYGMDSKKLNSKQKDFLMQSLSDEKTNLAIVARHLWQLSLIDFANKKILGDYEVKIIGARYNRGPHLSLEEIKKNTSYGDFIVKRKTKLLELIK